MEVTGPYGTRKLTEHQMMKMMNTLIMVPTNNLIFLLLVSACYSKLSKINVCSYSFFNMCVRAHTCLCNTWRNIFVSDELDMEEILWAHKTQRVRHKCDCLPACTSLQYDAKASLRDFSDIHLYFRNIGKDGIVFHK